MSKAPLPLTPAQLTWTEDGQPRSVGFDDIYFAQEGGMAETEAVFMQYNQLPQRWTQAERFVIGETGFGTGLNFLTTCFHFSAQTPSAHLRFISVEKFPLSLTDLQRAHQTLPECLQSWSEALLRDYPPPLPGLHRLHLSPQIELWLLFGEASEMLAQLPDACLIDAWYLDGFAPAKNPDMWTAQLFRQLAAHSHQQTTLATFTAASLVRKGLMAAGFSMHKAKGFGRKREMLYGHYAPQAYQLRRRPVKSPLPVFRSQITSADRIAVIGAGLAGATVANALAGAGFQVDVYETNKPAQAASGNLAGNCLPVIARDHGVYAQWYWQAWLQARRWWLGQEDRHLLGGFDGAFKWGSDAHTQQDWQAWVEAIARPDWLSWQAFQAPLKQSAMRIERAGFLRPQVVVQRLLSVAGIQLYVQTKVECLQQQGEHWLVHSHHGQRPYMAVVLATGAQLGDLLPEWQAYLQLQKGQVSHLRADAWQEAPQVSWSYQGYATPAVDGVYCVGATFERQQPLGLTEAAHDHNLNLLRQDAVGALHDDVSVVGGHSAYRAMTADHLPLVGQGVQVSAYLERLAACALHPDRCPDSADLLLPNLWFSVGHGSRGLTSSFLAADYLRDLITAKSPALLKKLQQAVHPARLPFRQLMQNALR